MADHPLPPTTHNLPSMPTVPEPEAIREALLAIYGSHFEDAATYRDKARELPVEIDAATKPALVSLMADISDEIDALEGIRIKEKNAYLRGGDMIHNTIKAETDKLVTTKTILGKRLTAYDQKIAAAERQRRAEEAEKAARAAAEAAARAAAEEQAKRDAEAAAARARKPENIAAHQERAAQHDANANEAAVDAMIAADQSLLARNATMAKSAELVRERHESGVMSTMRQVPYVEVIDRTKLDIAVLLPFFSDAELLKALKAWARTTSHKKPMAGAIIEMREESVIRR